MELASSTLTGRTGGGKARARQLAARILGQNRLPAPPEKLSALLLLMVRRAVRTQCGPAALVRWPDPNRCVTTIRMRKLILPL